MEPFQGAGCRLGCLRGGSISRRAPGPPGVLPVYRGPVHAHSGFPRHRHRAMPPGGRTSAPNPGRGHAPPALVRPLRLTHTPRTDTVTVPCLPEGGHQRPTPEGGMRLQRAQLRAHRAHARARMHVCMHACKYGVSTTTHTPPAHAHTHARTRHTTAAPLLPRRCSPAAAPLQRRINITAPLPPRRGPTAAARGAPPCSSTLGKF